MNRREFFQGASFLAIMAAAPASASLHGSAASVFNGGKSQGQGDQPNLPGDWPFANLIKLSLNTWTQGDNGATMSPAGYDANGYPAEAYINSKPFFTSGVNLLVGVPNPSSRAASSSHPFVLTWEGDATVGALFMNAAPGFTGSRAAATFNAGTGLWTGRWEFYPTYQTDPRIGSVTQPGFNITIFSIAAGSYINNLQLFFKDDETTPGVIPMFGPKFISVLQQGNQGVWRGLNWCGTSVTNETTWATRKPIGYPWWASPEYRGSLWGGFAAHVAATDGDYSLTIPGTYAWTGPLGNYTGGAPVHNMTLHTAFDTAANFVSNSEPQTLVITSFSPLTFSWPTLPLVNGDMVGLSTGNVGGIIISGVKGPGVTYYVVNTSGNTFQLSYTSGGTAISSTSVASGNNMFVTKVPTLNIGTGGKKAIKGPAGYPFIVSSQMPIASSTTGGQAQFGTLVFDADFDCWIADLSEGITNTVPIEVMFALCKQLGMHPYWTVPYLSLDPATDFTRSLAAYCIANGPSWMIPRFEPNNEVWNTATSATTYATNKAQFYWGSTNDPPTEWNNWYGLALSKMGQDLKTTFGAGTLGTKYECMCGSQYITSLVVGGWPEPRLLASAWVSNNAPAQSGYTIMSPVSLTSVVLSANYTSPNAINTFSEYQSAFAWGVTHLGNSVSQAADLNTYVDTMPTLGQINPGDQMSFYSGTAAWGSSHGITKMFGYEGGYATNIINKPALNNSWQGAISGATKASSCVLTLASTSIANIGGSFIGPVSGNPAVVGMAVGIQGVASMTQLNTPNTITASMTSGSSVITATNSLQAGQAVVFENSNVAVLPPGIIPGYPYYVLAAGLSGSQFQISLTSGGAAVTADPAGTLTGAWPNCPFDSGYFITAVSGNSVTIAVNSSAFTAFSGTTDGVAYYLGSTMMVDQFRLATFYATDLQAKTTVNYQNFALAGGTFPAQFLVSAVNDSWAPIQPDIYSTISPEWLAIAAYNH